MVAACFTEKGDCLLYLGRLDKAATMHEDAYVKNPNRTHEKQPYGGMNLFTTGHTPVRKYAQMLL
jgi:hypothetical protein